MRLRDEWVPGSLKGGCSIMIRRLQVCVRAFTNHLGREIGKPVNHRCFERRHSIVAQAIQIHAGVQDSPYAYRVVVLNCMDQSVDAVGLRG